MQKIIRIQNNSKKQRLLTKNVKFHILKYYSQGEEINAEL